MTHSRPHRTQERKSRDFPGSPMMTTMLPRQGMQVGSLLRELRAHMVKKLKKKKSRKKANLVSGSDQIRSVAQSCPTLCDPMNRSTPGLPVHHQLLEFIETHVHRVSIWIEHPKSRCIFRHEG